MSVIKAIFLTFLLGTLICVQAQDFNDDEGSRQFIDHPDKNEYQLASPGTDKHRFGYELTENKHFHHTTTELDGVRLGCYGYVNPKNNKKYSTQYVADVKGYRPVYTYDDITVYPKSGGDRTASFIKNLEDNENTQNIGLFFPDGCRGDDSMIIIPPKENIRPPPPARTPRPIPVTSPRPIPVATTKKNKGPLGSGRNPDPVPVPVPAGPAPPTPSVITRPDPPAAPPARGPAPVRPNPPISSRPNPPNPQNPSSGPYPPPNKPNPPFTASTYLPPDEPTTPRVTPKPVTPKPVTPKPVTPKPTQPRPTAKNIPVETTTKKPAKLGSGNPNKPSGPSNEKECEKCEQSNKSVPECPSSDSMPKIVIPILLKNGNGNGKGANGNGDSCPSYAKLILPADNVDVNNLKSNPKELVKMVLQQFS